MVLSYKYFRQIALYELSILHTRLVIGAFMLSVQVTHLCLSYQEALVFYQLEDFIITFGVEYFVENHRMVYFKWFINLGCVKN